MLARKSSRHQFSASGVQLSCQQTRSGNPLFCRISPAQLRAAALALLSTETTKTISLFNARKLARKRVEKFFRSPEKALTGFGSSASRSTASATWLARSERKLTSTPAIGVGLYAAQSEAPEAPALLLGTAQNTEIRCLSSKEARAIPNEPRGS